MTGVVRLLLTASFALSLASCDDAPPPPKADAPCVASEEVDHTDLLDGDVTWARFCPIVHQPDMIEADSLVPSDVMTTDLDAFVAVWDGSVRSRERLFGCGAHRGGSAYRVQIGYADGSVAEVTGWHRGCPESVGNAEQQVSGVFDALWSGLSAHDTVNRATVPCPRDPSTLPENERIDDNDGAVIDTRAIGGVVCDYARRKPLEEVLSPAHAERLRYLVSTDLDVSGVRLGTSEGRGEEEGVVFVPDPDRQPRLVGLVSAIGAEQWFSVTGNQHRVTLRDAETGRPRYVGKAGDLLLERLRDLTRR